MLILKADGLVGCYYMMNGPKFGCSGSNFRELVSVEETNSKINLKWINQFLLFVQWSLAQRMIPN